MKIKNNLYFYLLFFLVLVIGIGCKKNIETDNLAIDTPELTELDRKDEKGDIRKNINEYEIDPFNVEEPNFRGVELKSSLELKTIYFDYDRVDIKQEYKQSLEQSAKWLKENTDYKILIEGHTDRRGSIKYNLGLGQDRASKVRSYLAYLGIDPGRIATISYGKEKLVSNENTEVGHAKNRRVEFFIYKNISDN
ncbi:MAG: OmpA family protein [Elusimicrobiota bacterium]|jgi:peptidoglycan-associated lipoprotein|nr:OmpA family protein [Elusimicrobiota bacterium]